MIAWRWLSGVVAPSLLMVAGCTPGEARSADTQVESRAALVPLEIRTARGKVRFKVEVARTPDEQARGLMYRESMAPDRGMIFPMAPPRFASFWMKNTYIPLDIIFIRPDGTISNIANAIPHNLEPVDSSEPAAAVLEIGGGLAAANGVVPGDKVVWKNP